MSSRKRYLGKRRKAVAATSAVTTTASLPSQQQPTGRDDNVDPGLLQQSQELNIQACCSNPSILLFDINRNTPHQHHSSTSVLYSSWSDFASSSTINPNRTEWELRGYDPDKNWIGHREQIDYDSLSPEETDRTVILRVSMIYEWEQFMKNKIEPLLQELPLHIREHIFIIEPSIPSRPKRTLLLNYTPQALSEFLQIVAPGEHVSRALDEDGNLYSESWCFQRNCIGHDEFDNHSITANRCMIAYRFRGDPRELFPGCEKVWEKMEKEYDTFLLEVVKMKDNLTIFCSVDAHKQVAKGSFGGIEEMNTFHKENPGQIHSLSSSEITTPYHPEWFHNNDIFKRQSDAKKSAACKYLDMYFSHVPGGSHQCTVGRELLGIIGFSDEVKSMLEATRMSTLEYLLINHGSKMKINDGESDPCALAYYKKHSEAILDRFGLKSEDKVELWMLHRFMCSRGGKKTGEMATAASEFVKDLTKSGMSKDKAIERLECINAKLASKYKGMCKTYATGRKLQSNKSGRQSVTNEDLVKQLMSVACQSQQLHVQFMSK